MTTTTRITDLTVNELRALIKQTVREALDEFIAQADPDADLTFRPEVAEYLRHFLREAPQGTNLTDVVRELGFDD